MKKCIIALIILGITLSFNAWSQNKSKKHTVQDFEQIVLLSAIIDQCSIEDVLEEKKDYWQSFSKNYALSLIKENKYDMTFVGKVAATTLYRIDQRFGDNIPREICILALSDIQKVENQFKRDSLIIAHHKNTERYHN